MLYTEVNKKEPCKQMGLEEEQAQISFWGFVFFTWGECRTSVVLSHLTDVC